MGDLAARVAATATRLRDAEASLRPIPPIRDDFDEPDIATAYAIQAANVQVGRDAGRRVAGRKIGLTNKTVQAQFDVHQPDFGVLWADRAYADREPIPASHVLQPRVEAEVALVLDRDLDVDYPGPAELIRAVGFATAAIELVGSRITDWQISIFDTIADNASGGGFILGSRTVSLTGLDLPSVSMKLWSSAGTVVSEGGGKNCLGNPLTAAVWLARTVAALGEPLRAGEVILTGALGPIVTAAPGEEYTASISGLGKITATLERA